MRLLPHVPLLLLVVGAQSSRAATLTGTAGAHDACVAASIEPCDTVLAIKAGAGRYDDWQFELSSHGGARIGFAAGDVAGPTWLLDGSRFTRAEQPGEVGFTIVTSCADELALFSGVMLAGGDTGVSRRQLCGDSPPLPASAGIVLPTDGNPYAAPTPAGVQTFPMATASARLIAFAPLADVVPGGSCVAGEEPDPTTGRGIIAGYNILRLPGGRLAPPTADEIIRLGWNAYIDIDTFDWTLARPDLDRTDLAWAYNPDMLPATGDEVIYFADAVLWPNGTPRLEGPAQDTDYWYFIQPVFRGSISDFALVSLAGAPPADYRMDFDPLPGLDAVDVDGDGFPEFVSPQVRAGEPGLGMFHVGGTDPTCRRRRPRMIFSPGTFTTGVILPAANDMGVEIATEGQGVIVRLAPALTDASWSSCDVVRRRGASRVRVTDIPILLIDADQTVIEVRDEGVLRGRGTARSIAYEVIVHRADGGDDVLGPFAVPAPELGRHRP